MRMIVCAGFVFAWASACSGFQGDIDGRKPFDVWTQPGRVGADAIEWAWKAPIKDLLLIVADMDTPNPMRPGIADVSQKREALLAIVATRNAEEASRQSDVLIRYTKWLMVLTGVLVIDPLIKVLGGLRWLTVKIAKLGARSIVASRGRRSG